MKRSPIERRTPLTPKTELRRITALGQSRLARSTLHAGSAERRHQPKRAPTRNTGPSAKTVAQVWCRDEGRCVRCDKRCVFAERGTGWSVQHRRARGMGGTSRSDTNSPQNLIVLCGSATTGCHGWVESNRSAALSNGWAVKSNSDPLTESCVYRGSRRWLTDDGFVSSINPYAEEATMPNYVQQLTRDLSDRLPGCEMDLIDLYALLALTRGTETTLKDVHDAWSVWRNTSRPDHKSLIPFDDLTPEVQELDRKYQEAIHEAAKAVA